MYDSSIQGVLKKKGDFQFRVILHSTLETNFFFIMFVRMSSTYVDIIRHFQLVFDRCKG